MSKKPALPRLSSGELEVMAMLWQRGPLTLAEAHECFGRFARPVGYTTIQTRLNRLVDKRVVRRSRQRPAKYEAAVGADDVGARHIDVLLEKVSGGNVVPLVAHLISGRSLSTDEIAELKRLIAEAEASARTKPGARRRGGKP